MAMNKQRRTSNINNIITYDTLGNVTIPASFTVKGLVTAGFAKVDANGLFSVDTTVYQPLLPSQAGNSGKYLTTDGSVISWGTVASMGIGNAITSATAGSVLFAGTSGVLQQDNANFFWDDTNNRLGIGTSSPSSTLQVNGITNIVYNDNTLNNGFYVQNSNAGTNAYTGIALKDSSSNIVAGFQYVPNNFAFAPLRNTVLFASTGQSKLGFVANSAGIGGVRQDIYFSTFSGVNNMYIYGSTGNVVLQNGGTFSDAGYRLDVNGTARVSGDMTVNASLLFNTTMPSRHTATAYPAIFVGNTNSSIMSETGSGYKGIYISANTVRNIALSNNWTCQDTTQPAWLIGLNYETGITDFFAINRTAATSGAASFTTLFTVKGTGNVLINSTTDAGYRLDVNGTAIFRLAVTTIGTLTIGTQLYTDLIRPKTNTTELAILSAMNTTYGVSFWQSYNDADDRTTGTRSLIRAGITFNPTSGTAVRNQLLIDPIINQTGGASGISRGLYVNPTLTAAADFRAIETTAGNVLFGSNFYWDNTNSRLGIGTATPTHVATINTASSSLPPVRISDFYYDYFIGYGAAVGTTKNNNYTWTYRESNETWWVSSQGGHNFKIGATQVGRFTQVGFIVGTFTDDTFNRLQITGSAIFYGTSFTNKFTTAGRLLLGTTTESTYQLDVNGTARVSGDALVNGLTVGTGGSTTTIPNTVFGNGALNSTTTGTGQNLAFGFQAMSSLTTGSVNTAIGYRSANSLTTATNNVSLGVDSLRLATTSSNNVAIGTLSLTALTTSTGNNVAIGFSSGKAMTTAGGNVAIGSLSLGAATTGGGNTAIGNEAMDGLTTGTNNVAVGSACLGGASFNGSNNVAIGQAAAGSQTTGSDAVVIGTNAMVFQTTGGSNVAIGTDAARRISGGGNNTITNNSIFIGQDTRPLAISQTNQIVIGDTAIGLGSNTTIIGNSSTITTALRGRLLLGTTTDSGLYQLDVVGDGRFTGNLTAISTTASVTPTMLGWSAVNGYVQTTIPASTSFSAIGYAFSSLIGNNYMTYQGSATFAANTFTGAVVGINNIAFTAASSTITITQSASIRTYSAGLYQNTLSGSVNGTITHLSGLAVRPIFRASGTSTITVDNNYGLLIADQNEFSHATITNRWGIYQEGLSDNNYFSSKLLVGTTTDIASAKVIIDSTSQGVLVPRMTTTEINAITSPADGLLVYNTTISHMCCYLGSGWHKFNSSIM